MIEQFRKEIMQFPTQLLLIAIGALLFIPSIGTVHLFDWDEINFAESAREMLLTQNYRMVQINFQPFYEKPPLFIWLQAISMSYFGVNEFAARLPNAVCGIITMLVVFNAGRHVFKSQLGVLWAILFACSMLPQIYFKSGIIDPVFNLFIFLGIFFIYKLTIQNDFEDNRTRRRNRRWNLVLSALFIGLATLTKGPVAILVLVLTASTYFFVHRGKLKIELSEMLMWWVLVSIVVVTWLSFEIKANGLTFVDEFVKYQIRLFSTSDAGHGGPFYYHFVALLIGVFPASALIFDSFKKNAHDDSTQHYFKRWMIYLLVVVLLLFSIVKTKILHYSSLCNFPITFLAAYYLSHLFDGKMKWTWKQTVPLIMIGVLIVAGVTAGIFVMQRPEIVINYVKDEFAKECLKATVYWTRNDLYFVIPYLALLVISILLAQTKHVKLGAYMLIISTGLFVSTVMTFIIPRVEKYSQAALIEFLETKKKEECVIETAGFKSYAHYFYAAKPLPSANGENKTFYVVTKVNKLDKIRVWYWHYDLKELYRKNGWVFLERVNKPA
ncbi:MAG TPA: glycosyltransferase family 39 protein [Chitinophagales bacterium]|nr:glycosyltransferase family 39 protein [Chitinophagales bacterium]